MEQNGVVIVNENVVPEPAKLDGVKKVEDECKKKYEHLHRRLGKGEVFSEPSDIMSLVSQTADCLLQRLSPHEGKRAIFLVGSSGAGKSTFANWLLGREVKRETVEDEHGDEVTKLEVLGELFKVGHSLRSETLVPNVEEVPCRRDTVLIDFPGFKDTTSLEIRLGIDVAFRQACKFFKTVHVLALISIHAFQDERGSGARAQLSKLTRLLPSEGMPLGANECAKPAEACVWWVGITKCEKPFVDGPKRQFKEATRLLEEVGFKHKVLDINRTMSSGSAHCLCTELCAETRVALVDARRCGPFGDAFNGAFGALPASPKVLLTDCLNVKDCARFQSAFMTQAWTDKFMTGAPPDIKVEHASTLSFQQIKDLTGQSRDQLKTFLNVIEEDAIAMIQERKLGMERRCEHVKTLCSYRQCRMKSVFLAAEERVLRESRAHVAELVNKFAGLAQNLHKNNCITAAELQEITVEAERIESHIDKILRKEGYDGWQHYAGTVASVTGVLTAVASAGRLLWTVGSTVAEIAAGGLASVSAGAFGGLGIVVAAAGMAYQKWREVQTRAVTESLKQALSDLETAFESITQHTHHFAAMKDSLKALEILEID